MEVASIMESRVGWNDMGYMDGSYDGTVRKVVEGSGVMRGGARFWKEKR